MIKFYKNTMRSYKDIPNKISLIIHSVSCKCNLKCFGCFNYNELILKEHKEYYSENDVLNIIENSKDLIDVIIFSGGEFLLHELEDIESICSKIKRTYNKTIVIYTNGTQYDKVKYLLENKLVDGFHVDMKLPYHLMNVKEDEEIFKKILGITINNSTLENILKTINIIIKNNSKYSQIRTVKYPILPNEFFEEIELFIKELNKKYNAKVVYCLNEYIDI